MNLRTIAFGLSLTPLGLGIAASPAIAAEASGCYGAYYSDLQVLEVAKNHIVITANAFGTGYATTDPNSPLKGAAGPCLIFNEIIDGKPKGESRCVRTDSQGDQLLVIGKPSGTNSTGMTGTWEMRGLTGKWVGATGNGEWWDAGSGKGEKHYFLCFKGNFEMKK